MGNSSEISFESITNLLKGAKSLASDAETAAQLLEFAGLKTHSQECKKLAQQMSELQEFQSMKATALQSISAQFPAGDSRVVVNGINDYKSHMLRHLKKAHQDGVANLNALATFDKEKWAVSGNTSEYRQLVKVAVAGWSAEKRAQASVKVGLQLAFQTQPVNQWTKANKKYSDLMDLFDMENGGIAAKLALVPHTNAIASDVTAISKMAADMGQWHLDSAERTARENMRPRELVANFVRARQAYRANREELITARQAANATNASAMLTPDYLKSLAAAGEKMGKGLAAASDYFELLAGSGHFKSAVMESISLQAISGTEWRESGVQVHGAPMSVGSDIILPTCDGTAVSAVNATVNTITSGLDTSNMAPEFLGDAEEMAAYRAEGLPETGRKVSQPCAKNSECFTNACDVEGTFGCKGLCMVMDRSPYKHANFNCPGAFFMTPEELKQHNEGTQSL